MAITGLIIAALGRNPVDKGFIKPEKSDHDLSTESFDHDGYLIKLDALMVEGFDKTSTLTKSEVEDGATLSDHVTPSPDKLNIEAIISDTPLTFKGQGNFISSDIAALKSLAGQRFSKPAFDALYDLQEKRMPFTFVGGFKVYKNMVLTKFNPVRNSKTGGVLHFTATLEQLRTVTTQIIEKQTKNKVNGPTPVNKGPQPTQATDMPVVDAKGNDITAQAAPFQGNPLPSPVARLGALFDRIVKMLQITPQGL